MILEPLAEMLLLSVQRTPFPGKKHISLGFVGMFKLDLNSNNIENRVKLLVFVRGRIVSRVTAWKGISLLHEKEKLNGNTFIKEDHSELTCDCLDYSGQPLGLGET